MTDTPSAEALKFAARLQDDHEKWCARGPAQYDIAFALDAFAAQAAAASREPLSEEDTEQLADELALRCVKDARDDEMFNVLTDDKWHGFISQTIRTALSKRSSEWCPIETAPWDTTDGDFLISSWNRRGDCNWVQIVRNPHNHMGMRVATHWARLFEPDAASIEVAQNRLDEISLSLLDTASERVKPDAGDLEQQYTPAEISLSILLPITEKGEIVAGVDAIELHYKIRDAIAKDRAEARRAEREKCAKMVDELAEDANRHGDLEYSEHLERFATRMRALTLSSEGRS